MVSGNVGAIDKLRRDNVNIFVSPKNRVSFIICDDDGYFIFPKAGYSPMTISETTLLKWTL